MEWAFKRQIIAKERAGWPMEYIDRLPYSEVLEFFAVRGAVDKYLSPKKDNE